MDVERFVELIAAQDIIEYDINTQDVNDHNYIHVVYATIKDNMVVIAGTDESYVEIEIDNIEDIIHNPEEHTVEIIQGGGELYITYFNPGNNFE